MNEWFVWVGSRLAEKLGIALLASFVQRKVATLVRMAKWCGERIFGSRWPWPRERRRAVPPTLEELEDTCNSLLVALSNSSVGALREARNECQTICNRIRERRLAVYVFGHQKAGKSTLVNALLGQEGLSPKSDGKCTTCLVRIRWGDSRYVLARWTDSNTERIMRSRFGDKMRTWAETGTAVPREVIVSFDGEILGSAKNELIDTPGTGADNENVSGRPTDDDIAQEAMRAAAVAILVYRHDRGSTGAHRDVLRVLRERDIPVFAVCNVDPNFIHVRQHDQRGVERTLSNAEKDLRETCNAQCFRIMLEQPMTPKMRSVPHWLHNVAELRSAVTDVLKNRDKVVATEASVSGSRLAAQTMATLANQREPLRGPYEQMQRRLSELSSAMSSFVSCLSEHAEAMQSVGWGSLLGGVLGAVAGSLGGGPIGAVVGAAAGASVSGGAVYAVTRPAVDAIDAAWSHLTSVASKCAFLEQREARWLSGSWQVAKNSDNMASTLDQLRRTLELRVEQHDTTRAWRDYSSIIDQLDACVRRFREHRQHAP